LGDDGLHSAQAFWRAVEMDKKLTFRYDKVGDILYVDICPPYAEQESEEVGDEIIARMNPDSGAIENLEILFFSKRMNEESRFELPITAALRLAS
jgi:uncharacterized protein YuzE